MSTEDEIEIGEEERLDVSETTLPKRPVPKRSTRPTVVWPSRLRRAVNPYLPPPLLRAMDQIDPQLEPYVGQEGSVTVVLTLLLAWMVLGMVKFLSSRLLGRGSALADDDGDVMSKHTGSDYNATVLLCGPVSSGKTRIFYQLSFDKSAATVSSMKANVAIVPGDNNQRTRYMDWPGYADLNDDVLKPVFAARPRIVLVVDATQPMASAADCLDQLLSQASSIKKPLDILIACHKSDFPKAKNPKRVKIQIRTELERRLQSKGSTEWAAAGEPLDLDALSIAKLAFVATTCEKKTGMAVVREYCRTGHLPTE